jgi:hypothetical protein
MPLNGTLAVPSAPPLLTFKVAVFVPTEMGVNTTLTVQTAPAATDGVQLSVSENAFAFAPENRIFAMGSVRVPVFVRVSTWGGLATPVCTLPKATDVGDIV